MPRGLLSIYAFDQAWQISPFLHYGLQAIRNRGDRRFGVTTLKDQQFATKSKRGPPKTHPSPFTYRLEGSVAVATTTNQTRPVQPIVIQEPTPLSLVFDGVNPQIFAQVLSKELARSDPLEAAASAVERTAEPFAFVALTRRGEVLACRDSTGLKPLAIGNMGFDSGTVIASESPAMDAIGAEYKTQIAPGQAYLVTPYSIEKRQIATEAKIQLCVLEYLYLARPDTMLDLGEVGNIRKLLGEELAEEAPQEVSDVVVGIPESSTPQALSYSKRTGIPCAQGFAESICRVRNLLEEDQEARISAVQLKLNPMRSSIRDKRITLIDNIVVRGTTLKCAAQRLRGQGAKSINAVIAGPPITSQCPYSDLIPRRKELISAQLKREEIERALGLDSIEWLSIEGLIKALGTRKENLCLKCFVGGTP